MLTRDVCEWPGFKVGPADGGGHQLIFVPRFTWRTGAGTFFLAMRWPYACCDLGSRDSESWRLRALLLGVLAVLLSLMALPLAVFKLGQLVLSPRGVITRTRRDVVTSEWSTIQSADFKNSRALLHCRDSRIQPVAISGLPDHSYVGLIESFLVSKPTFDRTELEALASQVSRVARNRTLWRYGGRGWLGEFQA